MRLCQMLLHPESCTQPDIDALKEKLDLYRNSLDVGLFAVATLNFKSNRQINYNDPSVLYNLATQVHRALVFKTTNPQMAQHYEAILTTHAANVQIYDANVFQATQKGAAMRDLSALKLAEFQNVPGVVNAASRTEFSNMTVQQRMRLRRTLSNHSGFAVDLNIAQRSFSIHPVIVTKIRLRMNQ